jgi:hypothetical protein
MIWDVRVKEAWKYREGPIDYCTVSVPEDTSAEGYFKLWGTELQQLRSWLNGVWPTPEARDNYDIYLVVTHLPSAREKRADIHKEGPNKYRTKYEGSSVTLEASIKRMRKDLIAESLEGGQDGTTK